MCSPTLFITAAMAVMQGMAAKQQGDYANDVAQYNSRSQENQATAVANAGTEAENAHRQKVAQLVSQQKAQLAAGGVNVGAGTALTLQNDTKLQGEVDALKIRSNYQDKSASLLEQSKLTAADGAAKKSAGDNALTTSLIGAAASGVASKWYSPTSATTSTWTTAKAGGQTYHVDLG